MMRKNILALALTLVMTAGLFAQSAAEVYANTSPFEIPVPTASGTNVSRNAKAEIDYSNARYGYVMVRFLDRSAPGVRVIITGPRGTRYQYVLNTNGTWEVFPLTDGNGRYSIGVFEQITGNRFATANSTEINVTLVNEFAPFLRPNQFVNFNRNSRVVARANEVTQGSTSVIDSVSRVYNWVVDNISYDFQLAATVTSGYVPDVDAVLARGMGICFDYAAVMTAMLRSQGIPTQLVIGYAGDIFHAWISVYSAETGWINDAIWFDGTTWRVMDPTFTSTSNGSEEARAFVGNGQNHRPVSFH
ncbi:MAG: transglutaminase-like domain-containing protein [Defluviitaleaceae bacterium]|nr:transglutaminase-like domain-containing protein [Defluviitaleaceae bacterium]